MEVGGRGLVEDEDSHCPQVEDYDVAHKANGGEERAEQHAKPIEQALVVAMKSLHGTHKISPSPYTSFNTLTEISNSMFPI